MPEKRFRHGLVSTALVKTQQIAGHSLCTRRIYNIVDLREIMYGFLTLYGGRPSVQNSLLNSNIQPGIG